MMSNERQQMNARRGYAFPLSSIFVTKAPAADYAQSDCMAGDCNPWVSKTTAKWLWSP
jgi:hypothetical protein